MIQTNQTNVLAAFEMLLEEIENEVELVNRVGARAFGESNYERAEAAVEHGKQLRAYRKELAAKRRQWQELMASFDVEANEDEETRAQRRDLGRLAHGVRTPEEAYRLPVLKALQEMGGSGKTADVLDRVGKMMEGELKEVDYQELPSSGQLRWRNAAQWARTAMVNDGLINDNSPWGMWEISEEGKAYLEGQMGEVTGVSGSGVLKKGQGNITRAPNWTEQEFELLAQNPRLSDEEVAGKLERRTVGAVGVVREGLHNYHTGKHYESILSKMMKRRLEKEPVIICPRCGEKVQ